MIPLFLFACHGPETGIDRTVLTGSVVIPPLVVDEDLATDPLNDDIKGAIDLGTVTYRRTVISGYCTEFDQTGGGQPQGDNDLYVFEADGDISLDISFEYAFELAEGDTKAPEPTRYQARLYQVVGGSLKPIDGTPTDGNQGLLIWPHDLTGGTYALGIQGIEDTLGDGAYTLRLGGLDPNTTSVLVGAYASPDPAEKGPPLGGASVPEFLLEGDTWTGPFEIIGIKQVSTCEVGTEGCVDDKGITDTGDTADTGPKDTGDTADTGPKDTGDTSDTGPKDTGDTGPKDTGDTADTGPKDTGPKDTGETPTDDSGTPADDTSDDDDEGPDARITNTTVIEGAEQVYLIAGNFPNLNAGITAGLFFSSTAVDLTLEKETYDNLVVSLDTLQGKVIGWEVQEKEPNDASASHKQIKDPAVAQVLPSASGPGFVDVIHGLQSFPKDNPKYTGDMDVFALPVVLASDAYISISWADPSTNLDMYLFDSDGFQWIGGWWDLDTNPEDIAVLIDGKGLLEAGQTYYLGVYGWKGVAGDVPYTIEIEYIAGP